MRELERWKPPVHPAARGRISAGLALAASAGLVALLAIPNLWQVERLDLPGDCDPDALRSVNELLSPPRDTHDFQVATTIDKLVALGEPAIPIEIALLVGEIQLPDHAAHTQSTPVEPRALEKRSDILRAALHRCRVPLVLSHLREHARWADSLDVRLGVAALVAEIDSDDALDSLLAIAGGLDALELQRPYASRTLESALGTCIEHTSGAGAHLRHAFESSGRALWPLLARAAGRASTPDAATFLIGLLGHDEELDVQVARTLSELCTRVSVVLDEPALQDLRRNVDHPDARVRRSALAVLGRLHDCDAAASLIAALRDDDRAIARTAHDSLVVLAGFDGGFDADAWAHWYESESAWWSEAEARLARDIASSDAGRVFDAAREFARHPLYARHAADALGDVARHGSVELASVAIDALHGIEKSFAIAALVRALDRGDELEDKLLKSLRQLTGRDLGDDSARWRAALLATHSAA